MSILKTLGFIGFSAVIGMGVGFGMSDSKHKKEKEEFNNIKTEQDQEISDLTNALNEKTSTILLLEEQIETLNSELALNVVELAEKQSLLAEKQNELEIARNTITDNQINISELEVQVVNLQSQIGSLENENENLTSQVERLQAQLNELQKITFTIHTFEDDLFTYNATENMNFDEWINSEYNSNAVFIYSINDESNLIVSIIGDNTFYLTDSNGNYLTSETKIENGTRYILTDVSPNKTTQINFVVEYDDPNTYELTQTTLNAEEGMTWGEWIYSEYNTLNIYSDDGYIHTNLGAYILNGEEYILSSTVITADAIYSTTNFPEGYFDTINFNIKKDLMSSVEYSARKFMTWDEWVQSEFNTEGFKLNSQGTKILTSDNYAILLDGLEVNPTDIIIEDSEYSLSLMADLM